VFSHIYLGNLSPFTLAGYRARAGRNELVVDNFFTEKIINDFSSQTSESMKSTISRDFL
jgi:hypothetical protein